MKIQYFSDLHMEMSDISFMPAPNVDLIVSAGDINTGRDGVRWAIKHSSGLGIPWVYVIGNHEYYHGNLFSTLNEIRAAAAGSNVHVLERDEFVYGGIRFLGTTLWTNFKLHENARASINECWERVHDFSRILDHKDGQEISPYALMELHSDSLYWLSQKLQQPFDGKTIVVSHHAPTKKSIDPRFQERKLSAAYASSLEYLFVEHDITAWIHGHVHRTVDEIIDGVRILSNPRGYCSENSDFLIERTIEV